MSDKKDRTQEESEEIVELSKTNYEDRFILINENINSKSIEQAILTIRKVNAEDEEKEKTQVDYVREPIILIVDSYGGSAYDGFGLINMMTTSKTPVHTYCYSKAMSMGFMILISGHKRFIHEHAVALYHQTSSGVSGTFQDIKEHAEQSQALNNRVNTIITKRTNIQWKKLQRIRERKQDWYIYGKEAVELGIADELIKDTI